MTSDTAKAPDRGSRTLLALIAGITIGVLVATLATPGAREVTVVQGEGDDPRLAAEDGEQPDGAAGSSAPARSDGEVRDGAAADPDSAGQRPQAADREDAEGAAGPDGTDAQSGQQGPSASASGQPTGEDAGGEGSARGVTEDTIRLGISLPDVGPAAEFHEAFDIGDVREQVEAVLDRWEREDLVPLHGREFEPIFREHSIIGTEEQVATCRGFVQDDEVFAVLGIRSYEAGSECLAEAETPSIHLKGSSDAHHERIHPYGFTIWPSMSRVGRNWMHWAEGNGFLEGRTIGLYYGERPIMEDMAANVKATLDDLGYEVAAEATTENPTFGGPEDSVAVQRFRTAGVDLALLVTGVVSMTNFMQQADAQLYEPMYLASDIQDQTADAASQLYHAEQWDGTYGMTSMRVGELRATGELSPLGEECIANYERYSGRDLGREPPESGEFYNTLVVCDNMDLFRRGFEVAGPDLTLNGFIDGMSSLRDIPLAGHANADYTPGRHQGVDQRRTIQWDAECECWTAVDAFEPFSQP